MQSIIQSGTDCFLCGRPETAFSRNDEHHIFGGRNRGKSEKFKLKAKLCRRCHDGVTTAVKGTLWWKAKEYLERTAQQEFEKQIGTREDFIKEFGRNYL